MSEFRQDYLLQGQAKRMDGSCFKGPNSLMGFGKKFLQAKFVRRAVWCVVRRVSVTSLLLSASIGSLLVLSQKLPSSSRLGALVLVELRDRGQAVLPSPAHSRRKSRPHGRTMRSLAVLNSNYLNLAFGTQSRSRKLKVFLL